MPGGGRERRCCPRPRGWPCRAGCAAAPRRPTTSTTSREQHDEDVLGRHQDRARVPRRRAGELGVLVGAGAGEVLVDVAQEDRQADAHHHHRDQAGAAVPQRPPQRPVVEPAEAGRGDRGDHDGDRDRDVGAADRDGAGQRVDAVGDQRAEGDQLAVREVGQARRAEDHRQPERGHRQQQREHDAADGELQGLDPEPGAGRGVVADREGDEDVGVEVEGPLQRDLLRVAQRGALGQRALVDLDRERLAEVVDRLAGQRDVEDAGLVAGAVADDLAGLVLDVDLDAGDRLGRLLALVEQAALDVDGVVVAGFGLHAGLRSAAVRTAGGGGRSAPVITSADTTVPSSMTS